MKRDNLFLLLTEIEPYKKEQLLYRLYGLMENYEQNGELLSPDKFFSVIKSNVEVKK